MKIHAPEVTTRNGTIRIEARVETDARPPKIPETIWYEFPEKFAPMIYSSSRWASGKT